MFGEGECLNNWDKLSLFKVAKFLNYLALPVLAPHASVSMLHSNQILRSKLKVLVSVCHQNIMF